MNTHTHQLHYWLTLNLTSMIVKPNYLVWLCPAHNFSTVELILAKHGTMMHFRTGVCHILQSYYCDLDLEHLTSKIVKPCLDLCMMHNFCTLALRWQKFVCWNIMLNTKIKSFSLWPLTCLNTITGVIYMVVLALLCRQL